MNVRWTFEAGNDLDRIADYLHREAPAVAARILTEIYGGAMGLGQTPYLGGSYQDRRNTRHLFVAKTYLIIYRLSGGSVHILRIRHTSQKPLKY